MKNPDNRTSPVPILAAASLALLAASAQAENILMVTNNLGNTQSLSDFLVSEGHSVVRDPRTSGPLADDASNFDLVIVARSTNSGDYSQAPEPVNWNSLPIPIINMAPHIMRDSRWGWITTSDLASITEASYDTYTNPGHPTLAGLSSPKETIFTSGQTMETMATTDLLPGALLVSTWASGSRLGIFTFPAGTTMDNGTGTAGAFRIGWVAGRETDWNDINSNGEQILRNMIAFLFAPDTDGDGMSDAWEISNGLNENDDGSVGESAAGLKDGPNGALGDVDADTVTNLEEYQRGSLPNNTDSDGDSLPDGVETVTGLYFDLSDTGTSPAFADTDDDGNDDVAENDSGIWSSVSDTGTNPNDPDTDDDGLLDGAENFNGVDNGPDVWGTDPHNPDSDGDGLIDGDEPGYGLDPNVDDSLGDLDSDGSVNTDEVLYGTDVNDPDTDDDGLLDGPETNLGFWVSATDTGTDPLVPDTDGDGLLDGVESCDGVFTSATATGTDPNIADTDGDPMNLDDGAEVGFGLDPNVDDSADDLDGDSISNLDEVIGWGPLLDFFTNPNNEDSDGDGLLDGYENGDGIYTDSMNVGTDPDDPDTDLDELPDGEEVITIGTDPHDDDTDGDSLYDGEEVGFGMDPLDDGTTGESAPGLMDGPNGLAGDLDGDGISNEDEIFGWGDLNVVTAPDNDDTDGDGLLDGVEDGNGAYISAAETGTDPTLEDSDGDCLVDGVETATGVYVSATDTGTDPNTVNMDDDAYVDGTEVLYGSDPTNGGDEPDAALLPNILFIGGAATPTQASDAAVFSYMACRYGLESITYIQASASTTEDGFGRDIILTSSTPGSGDIRGKFHNLPVPLINWEEAVSDSGAPGEFGMAAGMTKASGATPTTQMNLIAHPITVGLSSPVTLFTGQSGETISTVSPFAGLVAVGTAVDGAARGGTGQAIDSPVAGNAMILVAEAGDAVDPAVGIVGNVAPARRVMFPMTDGSFGLATADFRQLLGQSMDWAMDPDPVAGNVRYDGSVFMVTGGRLDPNGTYKLVRGTDLLGFPVDVETIAMPGTAAATFADPSPPEGKAFYRIEKQ